MYRLFNVWKIKISWNNFEEFLNFQYGFILFMIWNKEKSLYLN